MRRWLFVYICDRCGREIGDEPASWLQHPSSGLTYDLCTECTAAADDLISRFIDCKPVEKTKPKKKATRGAHLDLGKIGALRCAGLGIKAIAEEMKCSEQTIRNHMNEALNVYKGNEEE